MLEPGRRIIGSAIGRALADSTHVTGTRIFEAHALAASMATMSTNAPNRAQNRAAESIPNENLNISGKVKSKGWEARQQQRLRQQAVKQREREMAQEKEDEANRKREVRRERERKAEEKARLQAMAARVCHPVG